MKYIILFFALLAWVTLLFFCDKNCPIHFSFYNLDAFRKWLFFIIVWLPAPITTALLIKWVKNQPDSTGHFKRVCRVTLLIGSALITAALFIPVGFACLFLSGTLLCDYRTEIAQLQVGKHRVFFYRNDAPMISPEIDIEEKYPLLLGLERVNLLGCLVKQSTVSPKLIDEHRFSYVHQRTGTVYTCSFHTDSK